MKRSIIIPVLIALLSGCGEIDLDDNTYGAPTAVRKVLIAGTDTPFKREVIAKVIQSLGKSGAGFRVTGLNGLSTVNMNDFAAIVVISPIHAGKIDSRAEVFIRSQASGKKIVLFCTKGGENPTGEWGKVDLGVDTVTSASLTANAEKRAKELVDLVNKKTGK